MRKGSLEPPENSHPYLQLSIRKVSQSFGATLSSLPSLPGPRLWCFGSFSPLSALFSQQAAIIREKPSIWEMQSETRHTGASKMTRIMIQNVTNISTRYIQYISAGEDAAQTEFTTSSAAAVKVLTLHHDPPPHRHWERTFLTKINKFEHYCGVWRPPQLRSGGQGDSSQNEIWDLL